MHSRETATPMRRDKAGKPGPILAVTDSIVTEIAIPLAVGPLGLWERTVDRGNWSTCEEFMADG